MSDENPAPEEDAAINKALRVSKLQVELATLTDEPISSYLDEEIGECDHWAEDMDALESGATMPLSDILQRRRNFTPAPLSKLKHPIDVSESLWLLL